MENEHAVPKHTVNEDEFLKDAAREADLKNRIFSQQHNSDEDKPKSTTD
jgi:hypothetical protein